MKVEQDNVLDTGRKEVGYNGTISGFKKYAGHECMVLIFPKKAFVPMTSENKAAIAKAVIEQFGCPVKEIEDCPYGATDSGVPGTLFKMENGKTAWFPHEDEPGCLSLKKKEMYYCADCPWGLNEGSNECKTHMTKNGLQIARTSKT